MLAVMEAWRAVAASRYGVVPRGAADLTRRRVERELRSGALRLVGRRALVDTMAPPTPERALWAAVTDVGDGALLSGRAALWAYGAPVEVPDRPEVLVPRSHAVPRSPVATVRRVVPRETARRRTARGLPVVSVPVAVRRAAAETAFRDYVTLVEHVLRLRLATETQLRRCLGRGLVGASALRTALEVVTAESHSLWERRLAALIRRAGLPRPRRQVRVSTDPTYWVDFLFADFGVAVEVDGFAAHGGPGEFAYALRRARRLQVRGGLVVLAFSPAEIEADPSGVVTEIAAALVARNS